jgi:peptidoglycan/xylan/chitin deacetylase (PgdA/CDA1 family)
LTQSDYKGDTIKREMILLAMLLLLTIDYSNAQYGPVVSFGYDDGSDSWHHTGFPIFQEYGFPGVVWINADQWWVGLGNNGYHAVDTLLEMQNAGWEISSHTWDHQDITEWEVDTMKQWLDAHGFPNSGFAAPNGNWNHDRVNIVKRYHPYYSAQNTNDGGISQPFDLYFLRRCGLTNEQSIEEVREWLDDAVENNKWIIFYAHEIGETNTGWWQSPALLRMVFDEIVLRGIPVKTVREVVNDLFPPGCVIECSEDTTQDPVLTYFEEGGEDSLSTSVWNEYWHYSSGTEPHYYGSPVVYYHTSNDSLPVMKFYRNVPNGEYEVIASIIEYDAGRTYRLYYSFDESNPSQNNVEVNQNSDVSLGTLTITNGQFAVYTQKADVVSGDDGYVGWAFIRLIPRPLLLNLKVFLEGPYSGSGLMSTTLNTNNLIPLSSNKAYPAAVYGYYTVSNLTSIPSSDIVDWVLVELRTGTGSETTIERQVAFLKRDGTIVDTDGSSPVAFTGLSEGDYYVVVRHRNHLAIMTSSAIRLSSNSALYDFTTFQSQAYTTSTDPMIDLGGGVFGMFSGDTNDSGIITAADKSTVNSFNLNSGYYNADTNFSGIVTAADKTNINSNNLKQEFVP